MPLAPASGLSMSTQQYALLTKEFRKHTCPNHYKTRIELLLLSSIIGGSCSIHATARQVGVSVKTVQHWRKVWSANYDSLCILELAASAKKSCQQYTLLKGMLVVLSDSARSGCPARIGTEQIDQIVALACTKPEEHDLPFSVWTHNLLAQTIVAKGIVVSISQRHVANLLKKKAVSSPKCLLAVSKDS